MTSITTEKLTKISVDAALNQDWPAALEANKQILNQNPNHIPTLNRLAKAYFESGQADDACQAYQQVIELDNFNAIAKKNLEKIKSSDNHNCNGSTRITTNFIDEPGKTKTTSLNRLANAEVINRLVPGQIVGWKEKNRWVAVITDDGQQIGTICDEVSILIKKQIPNGTDYQLALKAVSPKRVTVFIRETNPNSTNTHTFS